MTDPVSIDERTLVLRAQDGDAAAFEQLVDLHQGRLFRLAYMILGDRQDAEDVVQESLVLAWKRLHLLEDPSSFRAWTSRICTNGATDVGRRRSRRRTEVAEDLALEDRRAQAVGAGRADDPAHEALVNAQLQALSRILADLEPGLRTCWALREIDGMSYLDIARAVDATEPTVRGRIARARTRIAQRMQEWR